MKISYDQDRFTFSDITITEFMAINEFLKLAKLTSENHRFTISSCNTADSELTKLGMKLSNQVRDYVSYPFDDEKGDDEKGDEPVQPIKPIIKTTI